MHCVSLSVFRFPPLAARLWVLGQMGAARFALPKVAGLRAWKLCGSGTGQGFTPVPNTRVWAILAAWESEEIARAQTARADLFLRWRAKAEETWTVYLATTSTRGRWGGAEPFVADAAPGPGPLAALTRATIRPSAALRFWGRVPEISERIGEDADVIFKIGIGEVPFLHQVTFSIWPDLRSMTAFARADGPHARAIRAVREEALFAEELYARFRVLGEAGTWGGRPVLAERLAA